MDKWSIRLHQGVFMKDLFDILDVSLREDTYTCLIVEALRSSHSLLDNVVRKLCNHNFNFKRQTSLSFRECIDKTNDRPDIVIKADTDEGELWIVIEAKIKSCEGDRQCERYRQRLASRKSKEQQRHNTFSYELFYLTLTGQEPEDKAWKPIKQKAFADLISRCDNDHILNNDSALSLAWKAFMRRLDHYEQGAILHANMPIIQWLNQQEPEYFITSDDRLRQMAEKIIPDSWRHSSGIYNTKGKQSALIKAWKPRWLTGYFQKPDPLPLEHCISIHYELDLPCPCSAGEFACRIHCETNPYMTRKQVLSLGNAGNKYMAFSDVFKKNLHRQIQDTEWKPKNTLLEKGQLLCPITDQTTIGDLAQYLEPRFNACSEAINSALMDAGKQCGLPWWKEIRTIG